MAFRKSQPIFDCFLSNQQFCFPPVGSDDSDDDFEEVEEKEGFEPRIPDHLREEYGLVDKIQKPATEKVQFN